MVEHQHDYDGKSVDWIQFPVLLAKAHKDNFKFLLMRIVTIAGTIFVKYE